MLQRRLIALALALGIIAPAIAGCLTPAAAEVRTMNCCAELNCPAGHQQACYSRTSPSGSTQSTPELIVSLGTPLATHADALVAHPQNNEQGKAYGEYVLLHSPPDLYTVHSSLLI
jgi:hypothetical protein